MEVRREEGERKKESRVTREKLLVREERVPRVE